MSNYFQLSCVIAVPLTLYDKSSLPICHKQVCFEIYTADLKASTSSWAELFAAPLFNPAALPLVRCYSTRLPRSVASWVDYSRHEPNRALWAPRQWSQLAEGWFTIMWKIAVLRIEPTTCGSESERASHYTLAPLAKGLYRYCGIAVVHYSTVLWYRTVMRLLSRRL